MTKPCPLYFKPADLMAAFSRELETDAGPGGMRPGRRPNRRLPRLRRRLSSAVSRSVSALSGVALQRQPPASGIATLILRRPAVAEKAEPALARATYPKRGLLRQGHLSSHFVLGISGD